MMKLKHLVLAFGLALSVLASAQAADKKPNIVIIWGDDIGQFNISAYNMGRMGYKTPSIDSIATQGAVFTDWYGQQSCTAGRAAFITLLAGAVMRTGTIARSLPRTVGKCSREPLTTTVRPASRQRWISRPTP